MKPLFIPGCLTNLLDDSSSCDNSCIEFPRAESLDRNQFPRAGENRLSTTRGMSRGTGVGTLNSSDHSDQANMRPWICST